jgi:hypothetical protein
VEWLNVFPPRVILRNKEKEHGVHPVFFIWIEIYSLRPLQKSFKCLDYPTDVIPAQAGIHAKPSQAID